MVQKRKPLSEKVKSSLKAKAKDTKFFYGELAEVYRKGQGAYLGSGSRNVPGGFRNDPPPAFDLKTMVHSIFGSPKLFYESALPPQTSIRDLLAA